MKLTYLVLFFIVYLYGDITIETVKSPTLQKEINLLVRAWDYSYKELNKIIINPLQKLGQANEEWFDYEKENYLNHPAHVYFLHALCNDMVIGYCSFEKTSVLNEVYIRELAVDKDFRRKGIAKRLCFDEVFKILPLTSRILVVTRKINTPAISFYKKLGFKESLFTHSFFNGSEYISLEYIVQSN